MFIDSPGRHCIVRARVRLITKSVPLVRHIIDGERLDQRAETTLRHDLLLHVSVCGQVGQRPARLPLGVRVVGYGEGDERGEAVLLEELIVQLDHLH